MSVLVKNQPVDLIPRLENAQSIEQFGEVSKSNEIVHHTSSVSHPLFTRWRPTFHLLAPHGWLNDPCGPGYDPSTGKYHLAFQWNPNGNDWGEISWGHATSYDMVSWESSPRPCLTPSTWYDCQGIFTGCFQPSNINGEADGKLTYIYTSVKNLPIHYTLPYVDGSETLSIAVSDDGGTTWKRQPCNPILAGPIQGAKVTGWRDPFLTSSWNSALESLRRAYTDDDVTYGLISGGLVNHTPTVFVYAVKKTDLTDWKYVGILADPGLNFRPSRWSGDFGKNWEVANLVTLTDDEGTSRDFVIMGTEGCLPRDDKSVQDHKGSIARDGRIHRSQLWMCLESNESASSSSALMKYSYAGIFDNGLYYAANSFWDPVSQQQIVYGWITEEDLPDPIRYRQGWSGLISLPRVLKLNTMHGVKRARATNDLRDITSIEATPDLHGTCTVRTLGVRPDRRLEKLRAKASKRTLSDTILGPMGSLGCGRMTSNFLPLSTLQWEVDIEIAVGNNCSQVGFVVSDPDHIDKTVLFWDPVSETFVIERPPILSKNSSNDDIKLGQGREVSPHTLFTYTTEPREDNKNNILGHAIEKSTEVEETLHIRAIFDVSVLEVFVNERTALSTRIYHAYSAQQERVDVDGRGFGLYFFADHMSGESIEDPPARLLRATVWDGLSLP